MKGPRTNDRRFPLPRRTGHGDFPHPALARVVYSRTHSQRHEAHVFQVSIQANAGPDTPASLAASAQMFAQAAPYEMIELPKRLAGITQANNWPSLAGVDSSAQSVPAGVSDTAAD